MQNKLITWLPIDFNSVYVKLILIMFSILAPLMGLLIGSNSYAAHIIRQQVSDSYQRQAAFYTHVTDHTLSEIDLYLSNITINNSDFEILQSIKSYDNNYKTAYIRLNNKVRRDLFLYPLVDAFFYYDADNDYYSTIATSDENYKIKEDVYNYVKEIADFADPYDSETLRYWKPVRFSSDSLLLRVLESGNHYIGVWIKTPKLLKEYDLQNANSEAEIISAYIDEAGTPIVSDGKLPLDELNFSALSDGYTEKSGTAKYTIVGEGSKSGRFALISIIPDNVILSRLPVLSTVFRTLSFVLLFIVPLSTLLLRRIFREPFNTMTSSMRRIQEGNLDERIHTDHMSNEFCMVSCIFNEMMDNIRNLKLKIYEDEIARQNESLANLQMQVKPHFYLNSLNMIYTLARNNDIALVKDLSLSLIRYFRYVFNESTFVMLSEELAHIKNYLRIQELRFPSSFSYQIKLDDTLSNACVPYLLIQNFVENSMKYALTLDEKAELKILTGPTDKSCNSFFIRIEDNGPGFSDEILSQIRKGEVIKDHERKHLGIWNCRRRIQLLYKGTAKIEFDNLKPHGALVNITLPITYPDNSPEGETITGGTYESAAC